MESKKKIALLVVFTAIVSSLLTNTVRDIIYVKNDGALINKLSNIVKVLKNYSLYDIDSKELGDYAAAGMALSVNDHYTSYFSAEDFKSYQTDLSNSFLGVGIVISVDAKENKLVVVSPIEGGPAHKAGILTGDYIVKVEGIEYSAQQMNEAVRKIRGDDLENIKGTSIRITVERDGVLHDYTIIRDVIEQDSVNEKMIENDIGYIRIKAFNSASDVQDDSKDTYDEFMESLENLKNSGMKKLIIDLRGNPGGSLEVVNKIADELLPQGIVTYTQTKDGKRYDYTSKDGELGIPMAVLVNGGSASGSEVITGALKDYKKATVIGTKTFGKGIVQTIIPLGDGSGLSVTTSKYYSPNGICIHEVGIEPDIVVEMDEEKDISQISQNEDVQLKKALEILKAQN